MIKLLTIILLVLLILIGGKRGIKTFLSIYFNLALLFILVIITSWGFNPTIPTLVISIIISIIIQFFLNGTNKKTVSSFISVILILLVFTSITIILGNNIYIAGYSEETIESIGFINYNVGINMLPLSNSIIIIGLIGTINDTSIAISSALYELHENNKKLKPKELFISGMNIGRDILGTTANTLFFAFLGSSMPLFIFFQDFQYSLAGIINSQVFASEFTRIILSGISSFLIIPVSSIITTIILKYDKEDIYEKIEYYLRRQRTTSSRKRITSTNNSNRKKRK
ncbi:MAG: YibE/F family protein [Firmicutes bacterium]|nr:YibE/F family protein [Bacillota bacterium]